MKTVIFSLLLGLGAIASANAAEGNVDAGKTKAATCAACHGQNGIGIADNYPNLAGQHAEYIVKQLKAFKDGSRGDAVMAPMAMPLSDQDMADLGAYFASLDMSGAAAGGDTADAAPAKVEYIANAAAGRALYENGDAARNIPACTGCHGDNGDSKVLIYPNLSNQHPEYIVKQLTHFQKGERQDAAMNTYASLLTNEDIADIGAYFADPTVEPAMSKAVVAAEKTVFVGDVQAGEAKAAVCAACHGDKGNAQVAMYPSLAAQHEGYLFKQLMDFKKGPEGRDNAIMAGQVANLSEEDMKNLAAYFSAQQNTRAKTGATNALGQKLWFGGDEERGITACAGCHSPSGLGMDLAKFPSLKGQSSEYIKAQLALFKTGGRANDLNGMMRNIAIKLSDEEMAALAEFASGL
ncbi:c-type cytochrome [Thalassotalea agarivorans]|uniref:Cytochrome c553 n=1 Tax=Thalassotalea agarivorans TaxID=349064 RepID=A0A1I0CVU1_THASX|nr:c-type cytochrome [Thalassotalea agarivorans]SET23872.1 Cytochrome c553 [Thalassotalea agarivorans]